MVKKLLPFIILTGLIFIFFLRLFYPTLSIFMIPDFGESDVLHLNLPFKYILSASLKNQQWPLWTPYLASGFPILAEGQIGTFYLPNLILFRFLPIVWAYNLNLVISYLLASLGTYLFSRKIGLSIISSFFAGFIFTFSGFLAVHLNHFNLVQAASLLPLIFWSALVLWEKPKLKYSILLAFLVSQQIFTGHFYIVFITLFGIIIYIIGLFLTTTHCSMVVITRKIFVLFLSFVIAFLLSAIQLLSTIELWQLSARQSGLDFNTVTDYPYPVKHLITFIKPFFFGSPADGTYPPFSSDWGIFWENTAYVGLLPLFLALGSVLFLKDKIIKSFFIILFVSLLLVLGKNSPLYFIFSIFPFNLFRVPSKFLLLTTFSLTMMASFMLEKLKSQIHAIAAICYQRKFILIVISCLIFLFIVIDEYRFSYNYPPVTPADWWLSSPESIKFIEPNSNISSSLAPIAWNKIFKTQGWQDFRPYLYFKNSLYPNYNALFAIRGMDVNTGGLIPRRLSLFTSLSKNIDLHEDEKEASLNSTTTNAFSLAGVNYLLTPYKIEHLSFTLKTIIPSPDLQSEPFYIYQNNNSFPRSYLAYNGKKIDTLEDFNNKISSEDLVKQHLVLVEDDKLRFDSDVNQIKPANIISETHNEIILKASSDTPAILVLTDTNYPGWKAYVDGTLTKIYDVNLVQRGIYFPAGKHEVKFIYQSSSFELGKIITIFSWTIISLVVFLCSSVFPRKVSGNKKYQ